MKKYKLQLILIIRCDTHKLYEPEDVYHIGRLVGYSYNLCVPHPISINWSLYFFI